MSSTRIGQVRIRTDTDDPLAARMRGDAALRALDLEPPGMPSRVILCIRSMSDPLPGGLDLRSPHAPRATAWERAARQSIRDALSRAVRAIDGVPDSADAVLFADRAELLACAARDVVRSGGGWWWRETLRGGLAFEPVVREWLRAPEYVPAALEWLVMAGHAPAFLGALPTPQAMELLLQVLRVHTLEPMARDLVRALSVQIPPAPRRRASMPPLLRRLVPELDSAAVAELLTIEQHLFATVTLALRRGPAIVRSAPFRHEVGAWIASAASSPFVPSGIEEAAAAPAREEQGGSPATPASRVPKPGHEPASQAVSDHAVAERDTPPPSVRADSRHATATTPAPSTAAVARRTLPPPQQDATGPLHTIDSRHAGLFFLLNIAIALGFYDPLGHEEPIALDVWDFLALTGRALVPEIEEDDVWPLLAQLAHRELEELPELDEELLTRVRDALSTVLDLDALHEVEEVIPGSAAGDLDRTAPGQATQPAMPAAAFVIKRPGRITLSPAHLDVTFSLAAHPIEIRVAGLDRDPGWIPAAGRHVDFHFD